ncbi:DUF2341 domain-containing protein [Brenneria izadpanahii]|uniref:DUF2341 domain-containing protein n=1 Tax=Brenneria izadpanahii TaxID=2722756 RepID=A0ABX7USK8_9GAMM|nr:MotA/TolQ/ExbB proton channel family protein [Brenneria izadpanahii]QTF08708.1 DUF2341 domain-containing protein [Brenneria izadpanahii]
MQRLLTLLVICISILAPLSAQAWWQDEWSYRKQISIDATPQGAAITENVGRMPVLVRLHTGNFTFDGTQEQGADLRFVAGDDKTVLNHQIESFDPLLGIALIWVDVPAVEGGQRQDLWMYYGNDKAPSTASGQLIFDPDYTLVYHFDDASGVTPHDTTAYGNHAQNQPGAVIDGMIGRAALFTGGEPLMLPATQSLALAQGGAFTFSAWIRPDNAQGEQLVYARRDNGNALLIGLSQGVPFVEVNGQRAAASQLAAAGQWQMLSATAGAAGIDLYLNGRPIGHLDVALPALAAVTAIGGDIPGSAGYSESAAPASTDTQANGEPDAASADADDAAGSASAETQAQPVAPQYQPFIGAIDELRLSKVARSGSLLLADTLAQGVDARLVAYGVDEEQSGFGFGGLGFLLKSVPVDAWVVIVVLILMMFQSWYIMIHKNRHLSRVVRSNLRFREHFANAGTRYDALVDDPELNGALGNSSLWRLYQVAVREVRAREDRNGGERLITPAGIEAIRAAMDAARTVENQRLGTRMSTLSNAIAGGPYIGLLGTVLGIILVFLGTAMAGDVNINAIAPGMAAALVATAMGLFVAIPALFGYNRLVTKNREVGADMRMFTDEYLARLAELQESVALRQAGSRQPETSTAQR